MTTATIRPTLSSSEVRSSILMKHHDTVKVTSLESRVSSSSLSARPVAPSSLASRNPLSHTTPQKSSLSSQYQRREDSDENFSISCNQDVEESTASYNDDDVEESEQDPLLALFRVHNTNKVKFKLNSNQEKNSEVKDKVKETNYHEDSSCNWNDNEKKEAQSLGLTIKKFLSTSLFPHSDNILSHTPHSSESSPSSRTDEAIIKRILATPALPLTRRVTSFLHNFREGFNGIGTTASSDSAFTGEKLSHPRRSSWEKENFFLRQGTQRIRSHNSIYEEMVSSRSFNIKHWGNYFTKSNESTRSGAHPPPSEASNVVIAKLLKKAHEEHKVSFRYRLAMRYYLMALKEINMAGYPDNDPLMTKVLKSLNDVHHAQTTLENSTNIVKMGIQHEDKNQFIRALKMYTIAYRMRRDSLGVDHPSLPVLLNMMGSVQIKRGEFKEALNIYELAVKGVPEENNGNGRRRSTFRSQNPLTTSVTLRDMGIIYEHMDNEEKALMFYHASLRYAVKFMKGSQSSMLSDADESSKGMKDSRNEKKSKIGTQGETAAVALGFACDSWLDNMDIYDDSFSLDKVRVVNSVSIEKVPPSNNASSQQTKQASMEKQKHEMGEVELILDKRFDRWALSQEITKSFPSKFSYDDLFLLEEGVFQNSVNSDCVNVDIAMTLHQIGQIHRRNHRFDAALSAYNALLRGMKQLFGCENAHIAAILGNIGNLYVDMGHNDEALSIYQEVLGIETLQLGLSHPEVAITLHNIATIECSRSNFLEGVSLYKQVVDMQKIRFGQEHITVAITLSRLADAYEKLGNITAAIKTYEEALQIRSLVMGKLHIDVGRLMHKVGCLALSQKEYCVADVYVKRALGIYGMNKLPHDHLFIREISRDNADIQAGLAFRQMAVC